MALVNPLSREVAFKIVYYGPGLGGKTTTLEHLHATAKPEHRGKLVSLATPVDRTLYFDFLPIRLPPVRGMSVRLQLFTVPGQVYFNATRKLVLTGADGVVFVSDSQAARADANLESLENLRENLADQGRSIGPVPVVFQHNKRDLPDLLSLRELDATINPWGSPSFATIARTGDGVYEALESIAAAVLADFESRIPDSTSPGSGDALGRIEGGLAYALRSASMGDLTPPSVTRIAPPSDDWARAALPEHAALASPPPGATDTARSGARGASFARLWPEAERAAVREVEAALDDGQHALAVALCDALVTRTLAAASAWLGPAEGARDLAAVALLLGLDGRRYLALRRLAREGRAGGPVDAPRALVAFAFAIEARIALTALD